MRLREFFNDEKDKDNESDHKHSTEISKEKQARERNKIFMPPTGRDANLDLYIDLIQEDIMKGLKCNNGSNITEKERLALKSLMNNDNIVIRPADKGSGVVVMDKDDYITKVETDLNNNKSYDKLKQDRSTSMMNKVKKLIKDMHSKGWIDENLKQYMMPTKICQGKAKGNPKMHRQHPDEDNNQQRKPPNRESSRDRRTGTE